MSSVRKFMMAGVVVLGACGVFGAPAWAGSGYGSVSGKFGEPCRSTPCGPGQFNEPTGVAVNDTSGDVYVLDSGDDRVEWFNATGSQFEGQFDGSGEYEIKNKKETGAAAPTGKLSKPEGIAINNDPASASYGYVYVADAGHDVVDEFSATGEYKGQLTGGTCENEGEAPPCAGSPSKEPVKFSGKLNVATDPTGYLWVYEPGPVDVYQFDGTGALVGSPHHLEGRGGESAISSIAVDSDYDIYLTGGGDDVYKYPHVTGGRQPFAEAPSLTHATLAILASTNELLLNDGAEIELYNAGMESYATPLVVFPSEGLSDSAGIAVNGAEGWGTLYATLRAADNVEYFATSPATAPEVVSESAASFKSIEEAAFTATINSNNSETSYVFEYAPSEEMLEKEEGTKIPGAIPLPAGFSEQAVTVSGAKLESEAETIYYRVVATNKLGTTDGKILMYTKLPVVANEKYSDLTSTSVKLEATVNPEFIEATTYAFEYASSETLLKENKGTVVPGPGELPALNEPVPISTEISFLEPGHTYYYRVVAQNEVTKYRHNINDQKPVYGPSLPVTPYAPPLAITGEAENMTRTTATFSGELNPEGTEASYYFAYISEEGYQAALKEHASNPYALGDRTTSTAVSASDQTQPVGPIPASSMLPATTYHYALIATNKFETQTIGPDRTFTTAAKVLPGLSTGAASAISQNSATLSGTVTTGGLQTEYGFEIGTEPGNYGPPTGLGSVGGSLTETVSVTLGELQPGTTYYYRITATSDDGTFYGQPAVFATPGFPVLLTPQSELPEISVPGIAFPTTSQENTGTAKAKTLTKTQKLANALKACKKQKKGKRASCERQARKRYGPATKKKK